MDGGLGIEDGILLRSINKAGRVWGAGFSPKVIWGVVKEKAKICEISALAPHDLRRTCARLFIKRAVSWNKSSSYWDTFPCKRPSDTSAANSGSATR
jgi:hypothetical protein